MVHTLVADVIVGGFLGDEGKGKLVGALGPGYDAVLRVNASTNAGHTVSDGARTFVTRQLPSVFFPERTELVLAPGALLNLAALAEEVAGRPDVELLGGRLKIASAIALVLPPYILKGRGPMSELIGSTHQGTGPSAVARAARHALHLYDVRACAAGEPAAQAGVLEQIRRTCVETLPERFAAASAENEQYARDVLAGLVTAYHELTRRVGAFCVDYGHYLLGLRRRAGARVLVEGCNGLLLDNLHGAHPNVTSTSTNVGAMLCGANLAPADVGRVIVVIAAYATCLGKRRFPTEMTDDEARRLYARCPEIDPAESQRRRVGWIDLPALRKALLGARGAVLHLNKLDVLAGAGPVRMCTHYRLDGALLDVMPEDPREVQRAEPCYGELPGWDGPLEDVRAFGDLPAAARVFVRELETRLERPIASVGVGPRSQDILPVP